MMMSNKYILTVFFSLLMIGSAISQHCAFDEKHQALLQSMLPICSGLCKWKMKFISTVSML
ncbi:MAG: hypothetical protein IPM92_16970 [Saprospiraceae bacterium]|nr:hypothetical protein [Saprospiraceae bacterium]